jgi:hypothetical protein
MPTLDKRVGDRMDVCSPYVVGDNSKKGEQEFKYWWCQGKVLEKIGEMPPTGKVLWDAMLD